MRHFVGLVVLMQLAACGEVENIAEDANTGSIDAPIGSIDAPVGGIDASVTDAPPSAITINLRAVPSLPGIPMGSGRLVVMWFQLNDDGPDPELEKAYDVPFDPSVTSYQLPMSAITPPSDRNLLCPRSCTDESMCPCAGQPQVGTAYVILLTDPNGDGVISVPEEFGYNGATGPNPSVLFGVTRIVIGYGIMEYPNAVPYDNLFPEGISDGIAPYLATPPAAGGFDQLYEADPTETYDLVACDPEGATTCDNLPFPNLT